MIFPNPSIVEWPLWAATVVGYNPELSQVLHPGLPWRTFASFMAQAIPNVPNPEPFERWQDWASALKLSIQT